MYNIFLNTPPGIHTGLLIGAVIKEKKTYNSALLINSNNINMKQVVRRSKCTYYLDMFVT